MAPVKDELPTPTECLELSRQEIVLVADDEPRVLHSARRFLESHGYRVLAAANGHEAMRVAQAEATLHALVTDMVMLGPSGRDLAALVRERHPDTVVIYMSGYAEDSVSSGLILGPRERFLEKPFRLRTLLDTLDDLLKAR